MFDQVYNPTHYTADEAAGIGELLVFPYALASLFGYSHIRVLGWIGVVES